MSPTLILDIGTETVTALCAEYDEAGQLTVIGLSSIQAVGLERWRITSPLQLGRCVREAVDSATQSLDEAPDSVVLGVSTPAFQLFDGQGFSDIQPAGRSIGSDDLLQAINHSRQIVLPADLEQVQAIPSEFSVDGVGNLKKPLGKKGGRLNVSTIIVAAPKDTIDSLEQTLHSAQLTARSMVYRPVASALSVTEEDERIEGVAVADIGGWTTDLAIFANGRMEFAMTLPVGGSHITSDLASLLNMSFEDADELKKSEVEFPGTGVSDGKVSQVRQIGSEASRPIKQQVLCEIAECRILEIAKFIRREIEKSGYSRQIVAGIVLTGGTANIRGIERVFKREFDNMRCVTKAPSVASHPKRALNDPSLASATGIALFTLSSEAEDLEPASGQADWKQRVKAFWSLVGNGN